MSRVCSRVSRAAVVMTVLTALVSGASAASAPGATVLSVTVNGQVVALAAGTTSDGYDLHVAFVMRERGCDTVRVWRLDLRRVISLSPRWCERRVYGLALSQLGASWATYRRLADGRRVQEVWQVPVAPVRIYARARLLARAEVAAGERLPFVVGNDSFVRDGRVYAAGSPVPASAIPPLSSVPRWVSYEQGLVVVGYRDGRVETYNAERGPNHPVPTASTLLEPASELHVVRTLRARGIALMVGRRLLLRSETLVTGAGTDFPEASSYGDDRCFKPSCTPAALRFADHDGPFTVYVHGRQIRVRRILTGDDAAVLTPKAAPIHAQIRPTGLAYSAGNTITYLPRIQINRLLD